MTIFDAENGVMTLNLDKDVMRKLWDNYYVPFLKGLVRGQRPLPAAMT